MALGRRRHRSERQKIDATPPWSTDRERDTDVTTGPYDEQDAPDDGLERLDLGALLVPVIRGVEVRVDVGPDGPGHRGDPVVRGQRDADRRVRGAADRGDLGRGTQGDPGLDHPAGRYRAGGLGPVRHRADRADPGAGRLPERAVRRGGRAALVPARRCSAGRRRPTRRKAAVLEDTVRNIVVVRGTSPMPVRDPLPLALPADISGADRARSRGRRPAVEEPATREEEPADLGPTEEDAVPARPNPRRRRR